ncbi:YceK/YidQ family lipoprotein [Enterobacter asburiae]|uniref:YceK/YidQ family lipoprotein n=1 Tax=Enterobacter asburiae TaxID=61645 RepID=UPI003F56D2B5
MNSGFIARLFSVIAICLLLSGCGAFISRSQILELGGRPVQRSALYPATQFDVQCIPSQFFLPCLIDLPFSLVTDTLLLPVDIYQMN